VAPPAARRSQDRPCRATRPRSRSGARRTREALQIGRAGRASRRGTAARRRRLLNTGSSSAVFDQRATDAGVAQDATPQRAAGDRQGHRDLQRDALTPAMFHRIGVSFDAFCRLACVSPVCDSSSPRRHVRGAGVSRQIGANAARMRRNYGCARFNAPLRRPEQLGEISIAHTRRHWPRRYPDASSSENSGAMRTVMSLQNEVAALAVDTHTDTAVQSDSPRRCASVSLMWMWRRAQITPGRQRHASVRTFDGDTRRVGEVPGEPAPAHPTPSTNSSLREISTWSCAPGGSHEPHVLETAARADEPHGFLRRKLAVLRELCFWAATRDPARTMRRVSPGCRCAWRADTAMGIFGRGRLRAACREQPGGVLGHR
jgi:hypothetical protein